MKYLSASAYSLSFIQLIATIGSAIALHVYTFDTTEIIIIILGYFLYSCIGVSITLHRYYTHRSFEFRYKWIEYLFTFIAVVSGRGSPIGWVYVHRMHHKFADTPQDPHDPATVGAKIFVPHLVKYGEKIDKKLVKDLFNRTQLNINKYYNLIVLIWATGLYLVDVKFFICFYLIPMFFNYLALDLFVYLTHKYGYRNHNTNDNSKNNWFISLILWGEGWHNNHHNNPRDWNLRQKWFEIDICSWIIYLVKK